MYVAEYMREQQSDGRAGSLVAINLAMHSDST